jgi:hypothetical protein
MVCARARAPEVVPAWLARLLLFGALLTPVTLGLLEPRAVLVLAALSLGLAWMALCVWRPLPAFLTVLLVFVLAYSRLGLGLIAVAGPGNRGNVALGDLLWLGLVVAWAVRYGVSGRPWRLRTSYPASVWAMLPFVGLATALPMLGVLSGDRPLSYAVPGFRQLQWASFAVLASALARKYSARQVLRGMLGVMVFASVAHLFYSLVQLGFFFGALGRGWILLDDLFAARNPVSWFFYPRLTGLLVNPNSYGMYAALLLVLAAAMSLTRSSARPRGLWWLALVSATFGLAFSASRSALLGLAGAGVVWAFLALASSRLAARGPVCAGEIAVGGIPALAAWCSVLPEALRERFVRFVGVFSQGASADVNVSVRVEGWHWLWNIYRSDYPLGTWVPASYATGAAVDSFYLMTAVQGTPLFTLTWLLFLAATVALGWRAYRWAGVPLEAAGGLALAGWAGVMAAGGLALSPMLEPHLIVPFWTLVGISTAVGRKRRLP